VDTGETDEKSQSNRAGQGSHSGAGQSLPIRPSLEHNQTSQDKTFISLLGIRKNMVLGIYQRVPDMN